MANYQVWVALDDGDWNGDPSADPATNTGGMDISVLEGSTMFPTVQGSGDFGITCNFGASAFTHAVPSGYTAGWPASGGGFTTLDATKLHGSAALSGGNLVATFNTVAGMAQAVDGYTTGQYYFELTADTDIFSTFGGGGIGVNYTGAGNYNFWIADCAFDTGLNNGGAAGKSAGFNTYPVHTQALGVSSIASLGQPFSTGHVLRVAAFLTAANPPPVIPSQPVPQSLLRWRGQVGLNWLGMALVGDAFSNVVGLSDFANFTEYGNTMRMLVTTPPIQDDRKRIFFPRFEIEVQAGDGIPGSETPPVMMLDWSKDGGTTWSDQQLWRSMGAVGDYTQRLRWLNLGASRQWVFRLECTDPVRRYIIGVYHTAYRGLG